MVLKCFFKRHKFKRVYDVLVGGIAGRKVRCDFCDLEFWIYQAIEKKHRIGKARRIKCGYDWYA